MDDLKLMFATQPSVMKWVGIVMCFWSGILLIELAR